MIEIIIFSYNRAMQLEALLASIRQYWKRPGYHVSVIYNTSGTEFQKGYDILCKEYPAYRFIKETPHLRRWEPGAYLSLFNLKKIIRSPHLRRQKTDFRELLVKTLSESSAKFVMFLTDDSAFFRDVNLSDEELSFISARPEQNQISLRLGKDISNRPANIVESGGRLTWEFHEHRDAGSWGYNFSVDAHIYSAPYMNRTLRRVVFNNPSSLEVDVLYYSRMCRTLDRGMTWESPFILSYPINMVQQVEANENMGVSEVMLNRLFLGGKRMRYIVPDEVKEFQQYPESVIITDGENQELLSLK